MPQIAIRRAGETGWSTVESTRYPDEAYLQSLLHDSPFLVPFHEFRDAPPDAVVTLREFWLPGAGSSDLVFVDSDGALTVIECKLATNPEARRVVLAQVLEYGSALAGMSYADFNAMASRSLGNVDLADAMAEAVDSEEFDETAFRDAVTENLAAGEAELVIAIDQMNPNLRRLLDYVESRSGGRLKVFALEIQYHATEGLEALVPQIANPAGQLGRGSQPRGSTTNITVEEFRSRLKQITDERVRAGALELLGFCEQRAEWLARGRAGIGFVVSCRGVGRSLLTLEADGGFWINAGGLRDAVGDEPVERLLDDLQALPGFEAIPARRTQMTLKIIPTPQLGIRSVFEGFATAVTSFQGTVRESRLPTDDA